MTTLLLRKPLEFGKITVDKLNFRDSLTAGDLLAFDIKGNVAQNIAFIANLSGTDEAIIKQIDRHDYNAAMEIVNKLFADDDGDAEKK
jgi:hypothetical protein